MPSIASVHEAKACFAHPAPTYQAIYPDYFPGPIKFGCDQLKLTIPMSLCREPNASTNHENYRLALQKCESMLARLQTRQPGYRTRLKKMILSRPAGTLSENEAAAAQAIQATCRLASHASVGAFILTG